MNNKWYVLYGLVILITSSVFALSPDEILIITNDKNPSSMKIAEHYCLRRNVPEENIFQLSLDAPLDDTVSREKYNRQIAAPILEKLSQEPFDRNIKCLLTTYGVPFRVGPRSVAAGTEKILADITDIADDNAQIVRGTLTRLSYLGQTADQSPDFTSIKNNDKLIEAARKQADTVLTSIQRLLDADLQQKQYAQYVKYYKQLFGTGAVYNKAKQYPFLKLELTLADQLEYSDKIRDFERAQRTFTTPRQRLENDFYMLARQVSGFCGSLEMLSQDIKALNGAETSAALDSELSMIKFGEYELYRYQPNELAERTFWFGVKTLMVCRLDGPNETIAINLIDKAVAAENIPLEGTAYFDSGKPGDGQYALYNDYIRDTAAWFRNNTSLNVVEDTASSLFQPGQCPAAAFYCGWYSLEKYIDAFDFVNGAIGYHIASFEAVDLRDPQSTQWVPSMLKDGITATFGPVAEPYLHAFPRPDRFFAQIVKGKPLVEAYYRTKPFNSWQLMLIGDPLYCPHVPNRP